MLKVILLAGGKGERAKPFTEFSPKVMIPINGKPVIDYIVSHLVSFDVIDEVVIVCSKDHNYSDQIKGYFKGKEDLFGNKICFVEETFEGTGGAVLSAESSLVGENKFLVWFGDNLVPLDVDALVHFHNSKRGIASVVVSSSKRTETGFVEVASDNLILSFKEKPVISLSEPECLGIYLFDSKIMSIIKEVAVGKRNINLSFDVLENLPATKKLFSFDIKDLGWIDIESPVKAMRNSKVINGILSKMRNDSSD